MLRKIKLFIKITVVLLIANASFAVVLNSPYPNSEQKENTVHLSFSERPKHLDPARSYSSTEWTFISQIYEPPLQYSYTEKKYKLEPLMASKMPIIKKIKKNNKIYTEYIISIKPNCYFQIHPCFLKNNLNLSKKELNKINKFSDFKTGSTREVTAEDYIYQIKRLAVPTLNSPIYGFMSEYILGLKKLRADLSENNNINLQKYNLEGVKLISKYTYKIILNGDYPQFKYWLAMPFFAAVPFEADKFYAQKLMEKHNFNLDWYPVGTGPYVLSKNNPNSQMVLEKNNKFRGEKFNEDNLPYVNKFVFSLEKESIPYWNKFLQGYYDISGIASDNFNSALQISSTGNFELTKKIKNKGIKLHKTSSVSTMYWAFNMLDPVVGGNSEQARAIRKAINLSFDVKEFIDIFLNGRAAVANGPIPPDIFGYNEKVKIKKSVLEAKKILKKYKVKKNLTLYFDAISSGDPSEKAIYAWLKKQFKKIDLNLIVRASDYNRFQTKVRTGKAQIFFWGWNADYPDPENFLFMFYSKNSKVLYGGENASNYKNIEFDKLFDKFKLIDESEEKQKLINKMLDLLYKDNPWVFGFYPESYTLQHSWYDIKHINSMTKNTLKYVRLNPELRHYKIKKWNQAVILPLFIFFIILLIFIFPAVIGYAKHENSLAKRKLN